MLKSLMVLSQTQANIFPSGAKIKFDGAWESLVSIIRTIYPLSRFQRIT